ncbi:hypothetical protein, partial [Roseibium sp. RKSG952]|uniref:hypothetical protein n=1 Tax=Roseibium sp. RKSG952 TaxID=2529384 RepID=UPI001AD94A0E
PRPSGRGAVTSASVDRSDHPVGYLSLLGYFFMTVRAPLAENSQRFSGLSTIRERFWDMSGARHAGFLFSVCD